MLIKEVDIKAFGKLKNIKVKFENGLNVIYGPNESGKTTIHSFLGGILYGFLKPGVRSTLYSPEHSRYTPWHGDSYGGRAILEKEGILYIIERSFVKGKEETKIIEEATGENVTDRMNLGPSGRIAQPGYQFIGISSNVFNNTIYVGQRGIDTDSRFSEEIRDKIINASTSGDAAVSVDKALRLLDKKASEIGTGRSSRTVFGQLSKRFEEVNGRLSELYDSKDRYANTMLQKRELSIKISELEKRAKLLKSKLSIIARDRRFELQKQIDLIQMSIRELEYKCSIIESTKELREEDLEDCNRLEAEIMISRERILGLDEQWGALQDRALQILDHNDNSIEMDKLIEDGHRALQLETAIGKGNAESVGKDIEFLRVKKRRAIIFTFITSGTYLIAILAFYLLGDRGMIPNIQPILIAAILYLYFYITSTRSLKKKLEELTQIERLNVILQEHGKKDLKDLLEAFESAKYEKASRSFNGSQRRELEQMMLAIEDRRKLELSELSTLERQLLEILSSCGVTDVMDLKAGIRDKGLYYRILDEISHKMTELDILTKEIDSLSFEAVEVSIEDQLEYVSPLEEDSIKLELQTLQEKLIQGQLEFRELEGRLSSYEENLNGVIELEEERGVLEKQLKDLETERKAIELASERIRKLSGELHRDFAPVLNIEIGKILKKLTNGTYDKARVDQMLNARILDDSNGRMLAIDELSGGTADQLYLALRLGIINSLVPKGTPLFLDECFQQYDSKRLEGALSYIAEESKGRQVLLFTSQERELELLAKLGESYNRIELI